MTVAAPAALLSPNDEPKTTTPVPLSSPKSLADSQSTGGRGVFVKEDFQRGALGGGDGDDDFAINRDPHPESSGGADVQSEIEPALAGVPVLRPIS